MKCRFTLLIALGLFVPRLAFAACAAVSVTTATSTTNNWGANSVSGPLLESCQTLVDMTGAQLVPNAAAMSDSLANPTTTVFGALDEGWDATNSVWRRRWVLPGTGVTEVGPATAAARHFPGCTVGTTSAQCLAAATAVSFVQIQNTSAAASIACGWGVTAVLNSSTSFLLGPGQSASWGLSTGGVPTGALNCIASGASTPAYVEWN